MVEDSKQLFRQILNAFLTRYQFALPNLLTEATMPAPTEATTPASTEATAGTSDPS